jgi:hypothetical protein
MSRQVSLQVRGVMEQASVRPGEPLLVDRGIGSDELKTATDLNFGHQEPLPGITGTMLDADRGQSPGGTLGATQGASKYAQTVWIMSAGGQVACGVVEQPGRIDKSWIAPPSLRQISPQFGCIDP